MGLSTPSLVTYGSLFSKVPCKYAEFILGFGAHSVDVSIAMRDSRPLGDAIPGSGSVAGNPYLTDKGRLADDPGVVRARFESRLRFQSLRVLAT